MVLNPVKTKKKQRPRRKMLNILVLELPVFVLVVSSFSLLLSSAIVVILKLFNKTHDKTSQVHSTQLLKFFKFEIKLLTSKYY